MRRFGELSNRQRRMEIALRICQCALDTVGFGLQLQQCRELRLAAGAAVINDQLPGHGPGHIRPKSFSIMARVRSMPAVIPAEVHTGCR
jgi:hypothetical protein